VLSDVLILALPILGVLLSGAGFWAWDNRAWKARTRAAARPMAVRPFPHGVDWPAAPLDPGAGRAARKARHARSTQ
jgi:hypothetical protein